MTSRRTVERRNGGNEVKKPWFTINYGSHLWKKWLTTVLNFCSSWDSTTRIGRSFHNLIVAGMKLHQKLVWMVSTVLCHVYNVSIIYVPDCANDASLCLLLEKEYTIFLMKKNAIHKIEKVRYKKNSCRIAVLFSGIWLKDGLYLNYYCYYHHYHYYLRCQYINSIILIIVIDYRLARNKHVEILIKIEPRP